MYALLRPSLRAKASISLEERSEALALSEGLTSGTYPPLGFIEIFFMYALLRPSLRAKASISPHGTFSEVFFTLGYIETFAKSESLNFFVGESLSNYLKTSL